MSSIESVYVYKPFISCEASFVMVHYNSGFSKKYVKPFKLPATVTNFIVTHRPLFSSFNCLAEFKQIYYSCNTYDKKRSELYIPNFLRISPAESAPAESAVEKSSAPAPAESAVEKSSAPAPAESAVEKSSAPAPAESAPAPAENEAVQAVNTLSEKSPVPVPYVFPYLQQKRHIFLIGFLPCPFWGCPPYRARDQSNKF